MKTSLLLACALVLAARPASAAGDLDGILAPLPGLPAKPAAAAPGLLPARATMRLGAAEVFERVARRLTERLSIDDGELVLTPANAWTPIEAPAGTWEVILLEAPDLKGLTADFFVRFRVDTAGRALGEWQVPVRAQYLREVWVAARHLARGDVPAEGDLEKRRLDVLAERQAPISTRVPMDGFEAAQAVAAGQPLTDRDLVPRTLVHHGQTVNVVAADGPFSISMKALAVQDGANGATIKVRNLTSQREISAQVIGEGKVQVRF